MSLKELRGDTKSGPRVNTSMVGVYVMIGVTIRKYLMCRLAYSSSRRIKALKTPGGKAFIGLPESMLG